MIKLAFIWEWLKNSAANQLLVSILAICLAITLTCFWPITFEFKSIEVHDHIQVTKNTQYILRSVVEKNGAKVSVETNTYYNKISNPA